MKDIQDPVKLQKEILKKTYILSAFPVIFALIMGRYSSLIGFLLGLIISTLMFRLKYLNITRSVDMEEEKAEKFIRNRYFIEYFIYFAVLFAAARHPSLDFLAAALGLFIMKLTVLGWVLLDFIKDILQKKIDF